jgi:hypothetical protein
MATEGPFIDTADLDRPSGGLLFISRPVTTGLEHGVLMIDWCGSPARRFYISEAPDGAGLT